MGFIFIIRWNKAIDPAYIDSLSRYVRIYIANSVYIINNNFTFSCIFPPVRIHVI